MKSIDSDANHIVETTCDIPRYRDPQLQLWRKTVVSNIKEESRHSTSILFTRKFQYIAREIKSPSHDTTRPVTQPSAVHHIHFANVSDTFQSSDNFVSHVGGDVQRLSEKSADVELDIHDIHFQNADHVNDELDISLNRINQLLEQKQQQVVATVGDKQFTFYHTTMLGIGIIGLVLCVLVLRRENCFPAVVHRQHVKVIQPVILKTR